MEVILADDTALTRRLLQATLEQRGHTITAVADGAEAWLAFERSAPPLVVLDWQMPGLDGVEVCRRIRASSASRDVFVLMVTSRDSVCFGSVPTCRFTVPVVPRDVTLEVGR